MLKKLEAYRLHIESALAQLARIVNPDLWHDFIDDGDVLCHHVRLAITESITEFPTSAMRSLVEEILDEDSATGFENDAIASFLRMTVSSMRRVDPLDWWNEQKGWFPVITTMSETFLPFRRRPLPWSHDSVMLVIYWLRIAAVLETAWYKLSFCWRVDEYVWKGGTSTSVLHLVLPHHHLPWW